MNPIISRELLTRWRTLKAFALVLGYAVPLAAGVILAYYSAVSWETGFFYGVATKPGFTTISLTTGRALFSTLAWMQVAGWMIFAPTLTATTIAGERERGLLEALQLSCLTRRQIVGGKLTSALLFVLLSMVAALPVISICFLLGGVSLSDFIAVALLSLTTALCCACLGIAFSAWSHRGAAAMRSTYIAMAVWMFFVPFLSDVIGIGPLTSCFNPLGVAVQISEVHIGSYAAIGAPTTNLLANLPSWLGCIFFEAIASVILLIVAARGLRRPLVQRRWTDFSEKKSSGAPGVDKRRLVEMSSIARINFSNPILTREFRGRFRMRQVGKASRVLLIFLGVAAVLAYLWALFEVIFDPNSRASIWWWISFVGLAVISLAAPIMGACAFTREHETGVWPGIKLSSLSAHDIVRGKLQTIMLTCFAFTIPAWPLMILALLHADKVSTIYGPQPSALQAIETVTLIACTAWALGLCGMLISRFCRRTPTAVSWTLAVLFGLFFVLPGLLVWMSAPGDEISNLCWTLNPFGALTFVASPRDMALQNVNSALGVVLPLVFLVGVGLLSLTSLLFLVRIDLRSRE